jgi:hypothetical protein
MKSKRKIILKALMVFALMVGALSIFSSVPALAATAADKPEMVPGGTLRSLVLTVVNYFLGFLGLIAVIMVIYGGVTYVVSAGKDEAVGNAKKIIMYALVGLIIILLSFVLVNAVLGAAGGQ